MTEKSVPDMWQQGDAYEQYVGRWSRQVGPTFLARLGIPSDKRWVDVGCGTGALSSVILERCSPSSLTGVEPSEGFLQTAKALLRADVVLLQGTATSIPLPDDAADVVVSGLVLNFVPDQPGALLEMRRVTAAGGTIGAYVWDYAEKMELMRYFWDAAVAVDSSAAHMNESARFPICQPDSLAQLFREAGVADAEVAAIDIETRFNSFDDYWRPFLGGQGAAPAYAMSLDERARARVRDEVYRRLPIHADGTIDLIARAWTCHGTV